MQKVPTEIAEIDEPECEMKKKCLQSPFMTLTHDLTAGRRRSEKSPVSTQHLCSFGDMAHKIER